MKNLISAIATFLAFFDALSGVAIAQTFPVPPDIAAIYGPSGYIPTTATYAAGTTPNVLGDGSDAKGGTPPAFATMPADIPTPNRSSFIQTGTYSTPGTPATNTFCAVPSETFNGHGCPEPKFRTHLVDSHSLFDDPIRNYGLPGTSHCHTFFGNESANAYSTYQTVRTHRSGTAAGGDLNATAYWRPCMLTSDHPGYAIRTDFYVVYYNTLDDTNRLRVQRLPRGLRYIGGLNMDDPDDSLAKREVAIANAQPGTAGRYSYRSNGNVGWRCVATGDFSPALTNADGSDPFALLPGGTCPSGQVQMTIGFPECWDGKNLWYPGGYKHLRQVIIDNQAPGDQLVCPNGWYRLPQLQIIFTFTEAGASDYTHWSASSDPMAQSKLNSFAQCAADYSNAPCHEGATARTIRAGESFHTDWLGGWDDTTLISWSTNCLGILGAATAHQCEPSVISSTENLFYGPLPDGRTIVTTNTYGTGSTSLMMHVSSTHHGPATVHHHM